MYFNRYQKISVIFLGALILFWAALFVTHTTSGFYNYLYSFLFGLIPLLAGIVVIFSTNSWGGFKTAIGKAVFFIGVGIFLWGCGETIWSYYNFFLGVAAPYPSLADVGFAPSVFFYGLGTFYLSKASGAKYGLRSKKAKIFSVVIPVIIFVVSYYVLVVVARQGVLVPDGESPLKAFLDVVYPLGDFLSLAIATVITGLSFRYMGGLHKFNIISILLGLTIMFIADSIFSYTTTVGTYYNANFGDLVLTLGVFFLSLGVLGFYKSSRKSR